MTQKRLLCFWSIGIFPKKMKSHSGRLTAQGDNCVAVEKLDWIRLIVSHPACNDIVCPIIVF